MAGTEGMIYNANKQHKTMKRLQKNIDCLVINTNFSCISAMLLLEHQYFINLQNIIKFDRKKEKIFTLNAISHLYEDIFY